MVSTKWLVVTIVVVLWAAGVFHFFVPLPSTSLIVAFVVIAPFLFGFSIGLATILAGVIELPKEIRQIWITLEQAYESSSKPWPLHQTVAKGTGFLESTEVVLTASVDSSGISVHVGRGFPPPRITIPWQEIMSIGPANEASAGSQVQRRIRLRRLPSLRVIIPWNEREFGMHLPDEVGAS